MNRYFKLLIFILLYISINIFPQSNQSDAELERFSNYRPEDIPSYLIRPEQPDKLNDNFIEWKTSSGYDLDVYYGPLCTNKKSEIRFPIFIDVDPLKLKNLKLIMSVWDVDESSGEVDVVRFNGKVVGTLHGANNQWSINSFTLSPADIIGGTKQSPGKNEVVVYIDVNLAGWCVTVDWGSIRADGELEITEFIPGQFKLINFKNPDIRVKFNAELNPASVSSANFAIKYFNNNSGYSIVPCTFALSANKKEVTIKPNADLMDGVKYSLWVTGGLSGVQSAEGGIMESSRSFNFSTVPDLEINKDKLVPIQVVRNKKQIKEKDAVIRVYTDKWDKKANVHPSAQFENIDVKTTLKEGTTAVLEESETYFRKDKRETAENKKNGTNTTNLYTNWSTIATGNKTVELSLEPENQGGSTPVTFKETANIDLRENQKTLKIVYHFILAESWADSVNYVAKTRMENLMTRCKELFRDMFPVKDIEFTKGADIDVKTPLQNYSWPKAADYTGSQPIESVRPFRDTVKYILVNSDAFTNKGEGVAFIGLISDDFGQRSVEDGWTGERSYTGVSSTFSDGRKMILLRDDGGVEGMGANSTTVIHEFGHNFSISSKMHGGNKHTTDEMATQGFWVTKKKNKSTDEGNEEADNLLSLMSITIKPEKERWICDYDYNELYDNVLAAALNKINYAAGPHLIISGGYDLNNKFYLTPVWENDNYEANSYPNGGDLTLKLYTPTGTELLSYDFKSYTLVTEDATDDTIYSFSIVVPTPNNFGMLRIYKGSTLLKEVKKSSQAPVINITAPTNGTTWSGSSVKTLSWTGSDGDGDKLLYRVSLSSDNGTTWQSLLANYEGTSISVKSNQLTSSKNYKIKLSATDGLTTVHKEVSIVVNNGIGLQFLVPAKNELNVSVKTNIEATFPAALNSGVINNNSMYVRVSNSSTNIPGNVVYFPISRTIRFVPYSFLESNKTYNVVIKSGITDVLGNTLSSDFSWSFTTENDSADLEINSIHPDGGSSNFPINDDIEIRFNKSINTSTMNLTNIKLIENQSQTQVPGVYKYNSTNKGITFTPNSSLKKETVYNIVITTGLTSVDNMKLASTYEGVFISGSDSIGAISYTGSYSDSGIDGNNNGKYDYLGITIEIDTKTAGSYAINGKLTDSLGNELTWASNTRTFQVGTNRVELRFDGKIIYAYRMNSPYKLEDLQVYNTSNTSINDYLSHAYTTTNDYLFTDFETSTIPVVLSMYPEDGEKYIPPEVVVSVVFSNQMRKNTIDSTTFYITESSNQKISATVAYDDTKKMATLTPNKPLAIDSFYTVTITTSVKDSAGQALLKFYNWTFNVGIKPPTEGSIKELFTYPNPFPHSSLPTGGMRFTYVLGTTGGNLSIKVFNIAGDFIIEIPPEKTVTQEGYNEVSWDGKNNAGKEIASGTYLYIIYYTDPDGEEHKSIGKFTVIR